MGDWGIEGDKMSGALDAVFRASQATGPSVDRLSALMVQFGGPMRQLGFSFEETAGLLGKFEKEGVNTELVMGSMRIALGKMARDGEAPVETLRRVMDGIKNAGDAGAANAMALELFGARAGPDMAAAIREGRFEVGDLVDTITNGGESILGAAEDTRSFGEQWEMFKNNILVAIEPIATKVFTAMGDLMASLIPVVEKVIAAFEWLAQGDAQGFGEVMDNLLGNSGDYVGLFRGIGEAVLGVVDAAQRLFGAFQSGGFSGLIAEFGAVAQEAWPSIQSALSAGASLLAAWVSEQAPVWAEKLGQLLEQLGAWAQTTGLPLLSEKLRVFADAAVAWLREAVPPALEKLGELLGSVLDWVTNEGIPKLKEGSAQLLESFGAWAREALPAALSHLDELIIGLGEWIITKAVPFILEKAWNLLGALTQWLIDIVPRAIDLLWDLNWAVGDWLLTQMIPGLLEKGGQLLGAILSWIGDAVSQAPGKLAELGAAYIGWVIALPGKLAEAARGMWDFLWGGLKGAWNKVAEFFNGLPSLVVDVPDLLPGPDEYSIGLPKLPTFHDGGVVPGRPGDDVLAVLQAGEMVLTPEQQAAVGGGAQVTMHNYGADLDPHTFAELTSRKLAWQLAVAA